MAALVGMLLLLLLLVLVLVLRLRWIVLELFAIRRPEIARLLSGVF